MTLTQLNYIITIAETKSINKAAELLYVSQPSLTSAVRELEKELGITLFYRSGRGVTLTGDGAEFLLYARQLYGQYEEVMEKYGKGGSQKKKFGVSTQHYSFAVKAFVDMAKEFDMSKYEFAIRETRTAEVIRDVSTMKSEIGVLYLSEFNRKSLEKMLRSAGVVFHHLIDCQAFVYLWKNHPLAGEAGDEVRLERLGGETLMVPVRASLQEEINHWFNEIAQDREILCYYNSSASMLPMVERGMGIAICPGSARYFTGGDGIVYKTIVEPRKESRLYMVKRRYQMLPQAAGAFWDFVCSTFPPA